MKTCDDCSYYGIPVGESDPICLLADDHPDSYPEVLAYRDANQGGDMSHCPEFELYTPPPKQITLRRASSNGKPVLRMQPMSDGGPRMPYRSTVRWMESLWNLPSDTDDTQPTEDEP